MSAHVPRGLARRVGAACGRIVRPGMARVAAAQIGAHGGIEPRQKPGRSLVTCTGRCAGDSSSTTSGTLPPRDRGMLREAEHFLHPHRDLRALSALVVDRRSSSRSAPRNASAPPRSSRRAAAYGTQRHDRVGEFGRRNGLATVLSASAGTRPLVERAPLSRSSVEVGPFRRLRRGAGT